VIKEPITPNVLEKGRVQQPPIRWLQKKQRKGRRDTGRFGKRGNESSWQERRRPENSNKRAHGRVIGSKRTQREKQVPQGTGDYSKEAANWGCLKKILGGEELEGEEIITKKESFIPLRILPEGSLQKG